MLCLGSFLLVNFCKIAFKTAKSIGSKAKKIKVFCENNAYFDSILAFIVTPGPNIWFELQAQCFNSVLLLKHEYHIYPGPGFLQRLS